MNKLLPAVCGACLAFAPPFALAFQPLITDDTGTQGTAGKQIEFAINEERQSAGSDSTRTLTLPLVFTLGLGDTLDAYVGLSHSKIRSTLPGASASGGGNPALGAKWRFYENEQSKTSLGLKPEIRLPVSSGSENAGLGSGRASYGAVLILTQEVPFGAIHANLASNRDRYRSSSGIPDATSTRISLAPVWDVTEQWKLALDVGQETARAAGSDVRFRFAEIGVVYSPNKDLDFALGLVHGRDDANPGATTNTATLGVTWRSK